MERVDGELTTIIVRNRNQEEEFENAERARLEEAERVKQEQLAQSTRPAPFTDFNFHNSTSTQVRGEPNRTPTPDAAFQTANQNRQADRGVNFNPNPTRHMYTITMTTNSSDGYDQFTNATASGTNHTTD